MTELNSQPQLPEQLQPVLADEVIIPEISAEQSSTTLTWLKRGLIAGAIVGVAYGGYETVTHYDDVKSNIVKHDAWTLPAFAVTEGLAWGSTPFILGAAAKTLGVRKIKFADVPNHMRALERNKVFQIGMAVNMAGALGTSSVLVAGAESLPASARPLAYGVAAGSLAISGIPIKVGYMIDKRRQRNA